MKPFTIWTRPIMTDGRFYFRVNHIPYQGITQIIVFYKDDDRDECFAAFDIKNPNSVGTYAFCGMIYYPK